VPSTLSDYLLLYFRDSPTAENMVGGRILGVYCRLDLPRQLIYRIAHGLAEIVRLLSIRSPVQGSADVSTR